MQYRPEIDGLRAVAVVPVILFHGGLAGFRGGFVGVDVFFVISGYLITSILLNDLEKDRYSILKFYERRARRILPALLFVVLCCLPFAWMWMLPSELEDFGLSLVAVALFASNFLFWQQSGYFEASAELKPMLHTWSLAVEEQYYILFPLFLALVWRHRRHWYLASFVILAAISLGLAQWASHSMPTGNYYLSPMRFWEILAGSICAGLMRKYTLPASDAAGLAGVVLILFAMFFFTAATPTPSVWTLVPVGGTMLIILFAREGGTVAAMLGNRAFVGIGLISYSAYLWHQPLLAFYRLRTVDEPHGLVLALIVLATFGLAWLSWRFVEQPFRASPAGGFSQPQILRMGASTLAVIGGIGIWLSALNGLPSRTTPGGETFAEIVEIQESLRPNPGLHSDCDTKHFALPLNCRTSADASVVFWGDSYAMHLAPALSASETRVDFVQITKSSCGPFPGLAVDLGKTRWRDCIDFNDQALAWIAGSDAISAVILSSAFLQLEHPTFTREGTILTQDDVAAQMTRTIQSTQKYLAGFGKSMLIVSPPPQTGRSLGLCYVRHRVAGRPPGACDFERRQISRRNQVTSDILRSIEAEVPVIWFDDFICDAEICHIALDTISLYRDSGHLSVPGSTVLGRRVNLMGIVQSEVEGPR